VHLIAQPRKLPALFRKHVGACTRRVVIVPEQVQEAVRREKQNFFRGGVPAALGFAARAIHVDDDFTLARGVLQRDHIRRPIMTECAPVPAPTLEIIHEDELDLPTLSSIGRNVPQQSPHIVTPNARPTVAIKQREHGLVTAIARTHIAVVPALMRFVGV
jgi:hypothetical protein